MDPRVKVSEKTLKDQLNLGLEIWNASATNNSIKANLESLATQLTTIKPGNNGELNSGLNILENKITEIQKLLRGSDPANLETVVFSADREPTEQMRVGFNKLNKKIKLAVKGWNSLKDKEVISLNRSLNDLGMKTLNVKESVTAHYNRVK